MKIPLSSNCFRNYFVLVAYAICQRYCHTYNTKYHSVFGQQSFELLIHGVSPNTAEEMQEAVQLVVEEAFAHNSRGMRFVILILDGRNQHKVDDDFRRR